MDDDLREYSDPELYDAENLWGPDDDFYLALARRTGGPVLDLACGTGRLTRALAAAGLDVTGCDLSSRMLARARALASGQPIGWVEADCRRLDLGRRFRLVLMTGHAFQGLLTPADQNACLDRVRAHLEPGGLFAFETRNPGGALFDPPDRPTHWRSFQDPAGRWIDVATATRYDPSTGVAEVAIARTVRTTGAVLPSGIRLRYTPAVQLNELLAAHGLAVVAQYGDWPDLPLSPDSPEIITICRTTDPAG